MVLSDVFLFVSAILLLLPVFINVFISLLFTCFSVFFLIVFICEPLKVCPSLLLADQNLSIKVYLYLTGVYVLHFGLFSPPYRGFKMISYKSEFYFGDWIITDGNRC